MQKKAIITVPNKPPAKCPGNRPIGSENHLNLENHRSAAINSGPLMNPRIIATPGPTKPASGVMTIKPMRTPLTATSKPGFCFVERYVKNIVERKADAADKKVVSTTTVAP